MSLYCEFKRHLYSVLQCYAVYQDPSYSVRPSSCTTTSPHSTANSCFPVFVVVFKTPPSASLPFIFSCSRTSPLKNAHTSESIVVTIPYAELGFVRSGKSEKDSWRAPMSVRSVPCASRMRRLRRVKWLDQSVKRVELIACRGV